MIGKSVLIPEKSLVESDKAWRELEIYVKASKSEDEWTAHEKMEIEDLKIFREVLFNKYQRRRFHGRMS